MKFGLGQPVTITGCVKKVRASNPDRVLYKPDALPTDVGDGCEVSGFVVGMRKFTNHEIYGETLSYRTGWLVAWNMARNPIMVFEHQIVVKENA